MDLDVKFVIHPRPNQETKCDDSSQCIIEVRHSTTTARHPTKDIRSNRSLARRPHRVQALNIYNRVLRMRISDFTDGCI